MSLSVPPLKAGVSPPILELKAERKAEITKVSVS
jgi:hypothetical protein